MEEEGKLSSYQVNPDKNDYHWVLEEAGATVHAFEAFGSYQGDWLAHVTYDGKTGYIRDYYGSCSGCDAFQADSGWQDRTREDWHKFAVEFSQKYLEEILTYDEAMKLVSEHILWDMEVADMVKWLESTRSPAPVPGSGEEGE